MKNEVITEVVAQEQNPGALMLRATDVAGVCGEIVKRTAQTIQGRKYVRVEGWQSIAAAYGCVASSTNVEVLESGVRAIGELRRISDAVLLATAEGFVGNDEKTWANRPEYAKRAMAQTRAISRVCRSAFAFVVVLIDGKLSTTPAEEMAGVVGEEHGSDVDEALLIKAQEWADCGTDKYAAWWKGLKAEQRKAIGAERHEAFKKIAEKVPA